MGDLNSRWARLSRAVETCGPATWPERRETCRYGPRDNRVGWTKDDYVVEVIWTITAPPVRGMLQVVDVALCPTHRAEWEAATADGWKESSDATAAAQG